MRLDLINKTPNVCGGRACVGRRRVAVWMIIQAWRAGMSDEVIRSRYEPPLSLEELDAAFEYYDRHRREIDRDIRDNE